MYRSIVIAGLLLMGRGQASGQAEAGARAFEVASVKPVPPTAGSMVDFRMQPGGRLAIVHLTLREIIREAFGVKWYQLAGGPSWLDQDRFDIAARAEGNPTRGEMMKMLQALLTERFQLRVHRETREGSVYRLRLAKGGPRLQPSTAGEPFIRTIRNTPPELPGVSYSWLGRKASLAMIAERLGEQLGRPVVDDTRLPGEFDFKLDFAINDDPETGPAIFVALQEQLGLKLEAGRGPIETLVVDGAGKPSVN